MRRLHVDKIIVKPTGRKTMTLSVASGLTNSVNSTNRVLTVSESSATQSATTSQKLSVVKHTPAPLPGHSNPSAQRTAHDSPIEGTGHVHVSSVFAISVSQQLQSSNCERGRIRAESAHGIVPSSIALQERGVNPVVEVNSVRRKVVELVGEVGPE